MSKIQEALMHVRTFCPDVVAVRFDEDQCWNFMNSDNSSPSLEGHDINLELLKQALDEADLPSTHHLTSIESGGA